MRQWQRKGTNRDQNINEWENKYTNKLHNLGEQANSSTQPLYQDRTMEKPNLNSKHQAEQTWVYNKKSLVLGASLLVSTKHTEQDQCQYYSD